MAKKVIEGKVYNTETAKEIGSWWNGLGYSDFGHCEETLYKTKKNNYFLVGSGGPMSKYNKSIGQNQWSGDSNVFTVLSKQEALLWCENHSIDSEVIESEFSNLIQEA